MFLNFGGPGISVAERMNAFYNQFKNDARYQDLVDYYDFVSWDTRGVGRSSRIICDLFEQPQTSSGATNSSEQRAQLVKAFQAQGESCMARSEDGVAEFADTPSNARDLNLLRALLGEDKLNYLGMSWGSVLGGAAAALFPNRLNRVVLDGVESPNMTAKDANAWVAGAADVSFRFFLEQCQELELPEGVNCIFSGNSDQALQQLGAFLEAADANPIPVPGQPGNSFDGHKIFGTVYNILFVSSEAARAKLAEGFFMAETERDATIFQNIYEYVIPANTADAQATGRSVFNLVTCADRRITEAEEVEQTRQLIEQYPVIGKYFTDYNAIDINNLTMHAYSCLGLADRSDQELDLSNPEISPILLAASTGDPATPYVAGESYAKELANSVFLTFDGPGHCSFAQGASECTIKAVTDYFISGTMPANGTVCMT
jgi:pimeloyl-ACP methyl ester carboxylesterase